MNLVDQKFSEYLSTIEDQVVAEFLRETVFALPEDKRREVIIKHLPEMTLKVAIVPYDDDMGSAWKVKLGYTVLEDGFDSTADAEMWARDNGYTPVEYVQPKIWTVEVCRTTTAFKTLKVIATTEEEACDKAIDKAVNEEFGSGEADYSTPDGAF